MWHKWCDIIYVQSDECEIFRTYRENWDFVQKWIFKRWMVQWLENRRTTDYKDTSINNNMFTLKIKQTLTQIFSEFFYEVLYKNENFLNRDVLYRSSIIWVFEISWKVNLRFSKNSWGPKMDRKSLNYFSGFWPRDLSYCSRICF